MVTTAQTISSASPSHQAFGWAKGNLFGSALNSILTALVPAGMMLVANPFPTWVTETAEWPVMRPT